YPHQAPRPLPVAGAGRGMAFQSCAAGEDCAAQGGRAARLGEAVARAVVQRPVLSPAGQDPRAPRSARRIPGCALSRMASSPIVPVILAGGTGTRLWPISRDTMPKQFLPLVGERSTFQQALARVSDKT